MLSGFDQIQNRIFAVAQIMLTQKGVNYITNIQSCITIRGDTATTLVTYGRSIVLIKVNTVKKIK